MSILFLSLLLPWSVDYFLDQSRLIYLNLLPIGYKTKGCVVYTVQQITRAPDQQINLIDCVNGQALRLQIKEKTDSGRLSDLEDQSIPDIYIPKHMKFDSTESLKPREKMHVTPFHLAIIAQKAQYIYQDRKTLATKSLVLVYFITSWLVQAEIK